MKVVLQIAAAELRSLFYSPIAWAVLIFFVIQTSVSFISEIEQLAEFIFAYGNMGSLTGRIFGGISGLFGEVRQNLIFYVPLLTMGVISRELQSGSIKLVMSSPVYLGELIAGKYLAIVAYLSLFIVFILFLIFLGGVYVNDLDYSWLFTATLGIFLLASAYVAVGIFVSACTPYQLVAAIGTLAILALLTELGQLGQRLPLLADIAYWFSLSGRVDPLLRGFLLSEDLIYFLAVITMFLALTYTKLSAGRVGQSRMHQVMRYVGVVLVTVVVGYTSSLPQFAYYYDATKIKFNVLSQGAQGVMNELKGPWHIDVYSNVLSEQATRFRPRWRRALFDHLFERYERVNHHVSIEYHYYYAPTGNPLLYDEHPGMSYEEIAREYADQLNLRFDDFVNVRDPGKIDSLRNEQFRNVYEISWNGKTEILRTFDDISFFPSRDEIIGTLARLASGPYRVVFANGRGERGFDRPGSDGYGFALSDTMRRQALVNNGFNFELRSLDMPVPNTAEMLVIAGPTKPYTQVEIHHVLDFIQRGGNLLLLVEPGTTHNLQSIVEAVSLTAVGTRVLQPKKEDYSEHSEYVVFSNLTASAEEAGFLLPRSVSDRTVLLPGATGFEIGDAPGFDAISILEPATEFGDHDPSDRAFSLGVALEREVSGKQQRIVVLGDVDFMSTSVLLTREYDYMINPLFAESLFQWLSNDKYPVDISYPPATDNEMSFEIEDANSLRIALYAVLPVLITILGGGLLIARRRH